LPILEVSSLRHSILVFRAANVRMVEDRKDDTAAYRHAIAAA
jgi:hypothetical protein